MKKYLVNMVHPQQIVQKGFKGCNTTRTVTTFAQKYGVPWVWWKPTANQKVMLVDLTQFRATWNKAGNDNTNQTGGPKAFGNKTYGNKTSAAKTNMRAANSNSATSRTRTFNSGIARTTGNQNNYRSNYTRRRNAA